MPGRTHGQSSGLSALEHPSEQNVVQTPPQGSKQRFLKGALGTHAVFLDTGSAFHNSRIWSEEVGGAKVADEVMLELYNSIKVGDSVVID